MRRGQSDRPGDIGSSRRASSRDRFGDLLVGFGADLNAFVELRVIAVAVDAGPDLACKGVRERQRESGTAQEAAQDVQRPATQPTASTPGRAVQSVPPLTEQAPPARSLDQGSVRSSTCSADKADRLTLLEVALGVDAFEADTVVERARGEGVRADVPLATVAGAGGRADELASQSRRVAQKRLALGGLGAREERVGRAVTSDSRDMLGADAGPEGAVARFAELVEDGILLGIGRAGNGRVQVLAD